MWLVDPKLLCRQHLLGEHLEIHMFVGILRCRSISIKGYLDGGLLQMDKLFDRHEELAIEMKRRGYNHKSPLDKKEVENLIRLWSSNGFVNVEENLKELRKRCLECKMENSFT